ncbi:MAG: hypothetical protein RBQ97_01975 [Acholeplasma sp.]|nr:hypothetical protein [Acholeplasma sp.]
MKKKQLLNRFGEIGRNLSQDEDAIALLGLGSIGKELERLDDYSDLDFFVIVKNGKQKRFIDDLSWLDTNSSKVGYAFRNSNDGYKVLYDDGIYGEFAIFDLDAYAKAEFTEGRFEWIRDGYELNSKPKKEETLDRLSDWYFPINEAITNIYIGLLRYFRGEKLAAFVFIERYAFDNVLRVFHLIEKEQNYFPDPFSNHRRFELRYPINSKEVLSSLKGYDNILLSAKNLFAFIQKYWEINPVMAREIIKLLERKI